MTAQSPVPNPQSPVPSPQSPLPSPQSPRPHQSLGPGDEFDTIRLLMERWGDLAADIGDDAAVLSSATANVHAGRQIVVSTDACIDGAHFREGWLTPHEVGARAVAAALSDLAAMGARADALLLSFVVPELWRSRLGDVADGIGDVLRPTGARIIGGNLSRGDAFGITTTVIGSAVRPVSRRGAKPGDRLLVTGTLGGPGAALAAWNAGGRATGWARDRFAAPVPRFAEGARLAAVGVEAMLDISDGLAADARHLAAASSMRLRIDASRVPAGAGVTALEALASGEEYELLVAASPAVAATLQLDWSLHSRVALTDIGEVVEQCTGGTVEIVGLADIDRRVEFVPGHDHFTM